MRQLFSALYRRLIHPLLTARDSTEAVAAGAAVGMGIALTPTVGIQMPLAWLVATIFGVNRIVAVAMVWVSNPVTVLPLYYLEYWLGTKILGYEAISSFNDFSSHWSSMAQYGYLDKIRHLSETVGFPLLAGSLLPALLLGALTYPLTLWLVRRHRHRLRAEGRSVPGESEGQKEGDPVAESTADGSTPPAPSSSSSSEPDSSATPSAKHTALVGLILVLLGSVPAGCTDGNGSLHPHALPPQSEIKGDLSVHYSKIDGDILILISPYYPARVRNVYTGARLDQMLGLEPGSHLYLSLGLYHFGVRQEGASEGRSEEVAASRELRLGADGVTVTAQARSKLIRSDLPSKLLGGLADLHDRAALSALTGAGKIPDLEPQRMVRLLIVLPTRSGVPDLADLRVGLPGREVPLAAAILAAQAMETFELAPSLAGFEENVMDISSVAEAKAAPGEDS